MRANELERKVLLHFLADATAPIQKREMDFGNVHVLERRFTGVGFVVDFIKSEELSVADAAQSFV